MVYGRVIILKVVNTELHKAQSLCLAVRRRVCLCKPQQGRQQPAGQCGQVKKRKEKTTPFGVISTRSLVIYQAAQNAAKCSTSVLDCSLVSGKLRLFPPGSRPSVKSSLMSLHGSPFHILVNKRHAQLPSNCDTQQRLAGTNSHQRVVGGCLTCSAFIQVLLHMWYLSDPQDHLNPRV